MYCDHLPTAGPVYRPDEFKELKPPKIPIPRRNYEPREGFIGVVSSAEKTRASKPNGLFLNHIDAENGRKSAHRKSRNRRKNNV